MAVSHQFGFQHYLYLGVDTTAVPAPLAVDKKIGSGPTDLNDILPTGVGLGPTTANKSLLEYGNVRDLTVGGSPTTADITTRDEARTGFSSEVDVFQSGSMTFQARYKPRTVGTGKGTIQDQIFEALDDAARNRTSIAGVDLDGQLIDANGGIKGVFANWTVTITNTKPVAGAVIADVTLKLVSFSARIVWNATTKLFEEL